MRLLFSLLLCSIFLVCSSIQTIKVETQSLEEPNHIYEDNTISIFKESPEQTKVLGVTWNANTELDMSHYVVIIETSSVTDTIWSNFTISHPDTIFYIDFLKNIPYSDNDSLRIMLFLHAVDYAGNISVGSIVCANSLLSYGDFTGDWLIDFKDLPKLISLYGKAFINDSYSYNNYDANQDSVIDHKDISKFVGNYGKDKLWEQIPVYNVNSASYVIQRSNL